MKHLSAHLDLVLLIVGSALLLPFSACKKSVHNEAYYEAVSNYLYAYTSGDIGRMDAVRVRFAEAAVGQDQIGQPVQADFFSVSPALPGVPVWENDRTILLQPSEPLPYGKSYTGTVHLRALFKNAPREAAEFRFDFRVRELAFEVEILGLQTTDPANPRVQQIIGRLVANDALDPAAAEKILTAAQDNRSRKISWTHSEDGLRHDFAVRELARGNTRSRAQLEWSGRPVNSRQSGSTEVVIPALDEFVALSARVLQPDEQYVLLNFSDPVQADQDLQGMIRLDSYAGTQRFVVDGNFVRLYPDERLRGDYNLRVEAGLRNVAGAAMKGRSDWPLAFEDVRPAVRLAGRGVIIPKNSAGSVIFPFEAVGLRAVDIEVFKIFNANVLQYLQVNDLEGENELERVGKIVLQKKVDLQTLNPNARFTAWQRYGVDIQEIVNQDPGAIYQIRIAFRRGYRAAACAEALPETDENADQMAHLGRLDEDGALKSIMGGYRGIYFDDDSEGWWWEDNEDGESDPGRYSWYNRENPCKREYYNNERFARRNVFVSELGLTAKRGKDGSVFVMATDLNTAEPVSGLDIEFYNFQLQPIAKFRTDRSGAVSAESLREKPLLAVASGSGRKGYLRLADGGALSLSRFDVAGVEPQKGLKGFIYGERGVWRPGDSLYLHFVLEDKKGDLPLNHPVSFELADPKGNVQYRTVTGKQTGGVYALHCATNPDAPTGNWTAKVQAGGATFTKILKIETVKPNRLKLDLDFARKELLPGDEQLQGKLQVNWLHGAPAKNLRARVELHARAATTTFKNFAGFVFDDPARSFSADPQTLLDGNLDDQGRAGVPLNLHIENAAPGKLILQFKMRAFEGGGDFSSDNFALDYYPFKRFVGVAIPTNRWGAKVISEKGETIQFVCVDEKGRPAAGRKIQVGLYRCDWRWWWDEDYRDNVAQFNAADHFNAQDKTTLTTDQRGIASWKVKPGAWGRYLIRASDPESGHATGDFFWIGYPEDVQDMQSRNAAAMLPFSVEKEKYRTGEEVTLRVPAGENGKILLTLESGARVLRHLWFDAHAGDNVLKFPATADMAPTVYAHVSLQQPHAQTKNDLPIRMYGVMPVQVENPATHLEPTLSLPDVLKPGTPFTVSLREKSGKACAYTIAVVDEGLLDLTRFQTPNPWDAFYAREALGVKTWDVYDHVLGAFGAELERMLSIGGDAFNKKAKNAAQISRFKPVVKHIGPFYLEKGQTARHTLQIDNYVGSARVMAVCSAPAAKGQGAYGSAEKTCAVRKALMILPTLPRVLGPNETLRLPVDVFAMDKKVRSATIRVKEKSGLVSVVGNSTVTLDFSQPGQEMAYFDLRVGRRAGAARFTITAEGGGETTSADIELLVRNPNPPVTRVLEGVLEPGKEWSAQVDPTTYAEISGAKIEVSALPPINLSRHLEFLIQYPHGCIEQTVSAAFPQLFVDLIAPLTDKERQQIGRNVKAAVEKMRNFQNQEGGFSYWPGGYAADDWSSSYAGHFLLEAKNKGYALPQGMLDRWIVSQTKMARQWQAPAENPDAHFQRFDADLEQAYRLYTLALAGKPALGDMNRLRERKDLYAQSAGLLAAAYAQAGKPEAAREIAAKKWRSDWKYAWCGQTFGNDLRDRALLLETYVATGDRKRAETLVNQVCGYLGGTDAWYWNTQSLATALRALSRYVEKNSPEGPKYAARFGGGAYRPGDAGRAFSVTECTDQIQRGGSVSVRNNGKVKLYARLAVSGRPLEGEEPEMASGISLAVRYTDLKGNPIEPAQIRQGADMVAEVTVMRRKEDKLDFDYNELALSQVFPSGWEIINSRMSYASGGGSPAEYQDIRDDRVYTYFDLPFGDVRGGRSDVRAVTYRIQLNAAYSGRYYLPGVACESMYDKRVRAAVGGRWVEVL